MEIISSKLKFLLEEEDDDHFEDSTVIHELVLPMLNRWTNIVSLNQHDSSISLSKLWWDLYNVLNRLPQSGLIVCISQTEYLLDIILQHIQIDTFETDAAIWNISTKCFLLFLENIGGAVWQETSSTANDFFDNLLDIYQSADSTRAADFRSRTSPAQSMESMVLAVELMMAMLLKPVQASSNAYSQSLISIVANCIRDLMTHFKSAELDPIDYFPGFYDPNILNPSCFAMDGGGKHDCNDTSLGKQTEQELLKEEFQHFVEIVESYLTDSAKSCRCLLLEEVASIQTNNENNNMYFDDNNNYINNKNSYSNNGNNQRKNISIDQLDEVIFVKTVKSIPNYCFSIMLETLPIICGHKHLPQYPDIAGHVLSCHSHLCITPEV